MAFAVLLVNLVRNLSLGILFAFSVTVHQLYFTLYSDTGLRHCFMPYSVIIYKQNPIKHILDKKQLTHLTMNSHSWWILMSCPILVTAKDNVRL